MQYLTKEASYFEIFSNYCSGDKIKKGETGEACSI
jgi:hypothetical protein